MTKAKNDYQYTLEKRIVDLEAYNRRLNFYKQDYEQQFSLKGVVKPFYCLDEVHRGREDKCKQQCDYCERHH